MKKKVKEKKPKQCRCLSSIDRQLSKEGFRVATVFQLDFKDGAVRTYPLVRLEREEPRSRKEIPTVVCKFCPFCGKQLVYDT